MSGLNLDVAQLDRYSRHIIMEDIGPSGQKQLLDSRVLVVGAGGLGSPILQYLAAAGVGTIGIVDDDVVERSNLQRQVIHGEDNIGQPKVKSACEAIEQLNPDVEAITLQTRLVPENVEKLIDGYDFVVDGTDNFQTRYLINDACTLAGTPFSHGAIFKFEGQVTTFTGGNSAPCYRCMFPEAPPEGMVPDCATAGVLGVLPGLIGCIQATETIKALLLKGELLAGRLLFVDTLEFVFDEVQIRKDPSCPICGNNGVSSIDEVDYTASCAIPAD